MSSASSLPATGATPAAITGRVDDTETHLLSLPSLAAGLIGLLRGRGATVMWVDTSDWPDCYATTVLLISFPHETTLPSTSPSTGTDERLWRWWNIDIEEELQWRAALNDERTTLLDDTLAHIEAPTAKRAPLVDYLTGTAWEWSLPMRSTVDATQMAALAYWWETRVDEGHTPGPEGSAHLLLTLTLPSTAMGALAYTADGTPALTRHPTTADRPNT